MVPDAYVHRSPISENLLSHQATDAMQSTYAVIAIIYHLHRRKSESRRVAANGEESREQQLVARMKQRRSLEKREGRHRTYAYDAAAEAAQQSKETCSYKVTIKKLELHVRVTISDRMLVFSGASSVPLYHISV